MSSVVFTEVYSRYQGPNLTDEQVRDLNARARIRIAAEKAEKNRLKQEKKLAKANKKGKADLAAHRFGLLDLHGAEVVPDEAVPEPRGQGLLEEDTYEEEPDEEEEDDTEDPRRSSSFTPPPRQNSVTKEIRLGHFDDDDDDTPRSASASGTSAVAARGKQGGVTKETRLGSVSEDSSTPQLQPQATTREIRLGNIPTSEDTAPAATERQRGKSVSFDKIGDKEVGGPKRGERRGSVLKFLRRGSRSKSIDAS